MTMHKQCRETNHDFATRKRQKRAKQAKCLINSSDFEANFQKFQFGASNFALSALFTFFSIAQPNAKSRFW